MRARHRGRGVALVSRRRLRSRRRHWKNRRRSAARPHRFEGAGGRRCIAQRTPAGVHRMNDRMPLQQARRDALPTQAAAQMPSQYRTVRTATERLAAPLSAEDCVIQSMPDASPVKWHLAHTSWFFETVILSKLPGYKPFDSRFAFLFNSYYEALGPRHPRPRRGLLTRPSLDEVMVWRAHVDAAMHVVCADAHSDLR